MKPSIKKHFIVPFLMLFLITINAQKDQKIGLVLSGGGAKGLAHIGALKVIEEAGVEIDFVGGTSMGAIVGGLYAAGYSATELDSIFRTTNLPELIQDNVPRSAKTFYEKDDADRYALTLPFDEFKVSFPPGISSGQNVFNEFVRLLFHVKDVRDFNQLPIPFLCIATDVESGAQILLDKGYLPEAIMASGTLPSLFEPMEIDGKVLIDGGVVNNYPIDEVRALGADIIIGVDVQHGLSNRDALGSATEILLQINNYRTVKDMVEKRKKTDIYINPPIDDFSVIDFDKINDIINSGGLAAEENLQALYGLATREVRIKNKPVSSSDSLTINRLLLKGNDRYTRGYIKGKLRFNLGDKISFEKLSQGMSNLAATENFKAIRYELVSNGLGTDLILKLIEKPEKMYLRAGAHYDDLFKSAALMNITRKGLLFKDDVGSFDIILGDNIRYNAEYYVDKGTYWSFGVNSSFADFDTEIDFDLIRSNFEVDQGFGVSEINLDVSDLTNQIYLQTVVREEFAVSLGIEHKLLRYSTRTLNQVAPESDMAFNPSPSFRTFFEDSNFFSTYGRLRFDTYDDSYFPKSGLFFDGDFHVYLLSSDFNDNFKEFSVAKARMGAAFGILPGLSLNIESEGGFKLGTSGVTSFDFVLGGFGSQRLNNFVPFFGYDFLSLPGNSFVKAFARLDYEVAPKNHLMLTANIANVEDDIFRTGEWFTEPDFSGYGVGYGFESFLGPVQIFYSFSPQVDDGNLFISVGYWF
ncbi:patatin-like phospholipase family protein [Croceivirga thetidis]|uniref:Patatin n=1 Tax=Croceivirga thetidis TaxID=2721623 RepID=A0ABX1GNH3_9FLAO|nr:patatin-like phospholipase family protein [Croceivirga thetidis]NKI31453.1 patatin [Croceivirga thetidis]